MFWGIEKRKVFDIDADPSASSKKIVTRLT